MTPNEDFVRRAGFLQVSLGAAWAGEPPQAEGTSWTEAVRAELLTEAGEGRVVARGPPTRQDVSWRGERVVICSWLTRLHQGSRHGQFRLLPVSSWPQGHRPHPLEFPGPLAVHAPGTHTVRTQEGKTDWQLAMESLGESVRAGDQAGNWSRPCHFRDRWHRHWAFPMRWVGMALVLCTSMDV